MSLLPHFPIPTSQVPSDVAIRLRGVTKTFGKGAVAVPALSGVDMTVEAGQLIMLVGPSGCGKTTLLSVLSGVLDADEGEVELFGVDWSKLSVPQKTARRSEVVGFVFQQFNLIPTLTALDNVATALLVRGVSKAEAHRRSAAALDQVGLAKRIKSYPAQMSGGMQQRVAIARALVGKPRLLVCDEPTANLDAQTGHSAMDLIRAAGKEPDEQGRRRCVVVVTHDNRIFGYADRIEEMEDGRLKTKPSDFVLTEQHKRHADAGAGKP